MSETISLEHALRILKKHRLKIVIYTLLGGLLSAVITFFLIPPRYEAQTEILVSPAEGVTMTNNENIENSLQLIHTYRDIIGSETVLEQVVSNLELEQSTSALSEQISVRNEDQSQILRVTVIDGNPGQAERIANEIAVVFQDTVMAIMNVDNVSIMSPATIGAEGAPISPDPLINITVGIIASLLVVLTFIFMREFLDKSVADENDVQTFIGIPVVGSITRFEE
ncbi:YveK family protein [Salinicoccus sesuvii]|uniref:YveK family protein n=1 Tax=Salinicoccus sesuvii TaxID=868281 RepID=A0ABV7N7J4_9STAP